MTNSTNDISWKNLTPSSTRYCRRSEGDEVEIKSLVPTEIVINNISVSINCKLVMTTVDGKVINYLTDTSRQRCFICDYGPKKYVRFI